MGDVVVSRSDVEDFEILERLEEMWHVAISRGLVSGGYSDVHEVREMAFEQGYDLSEGQIGWAMRRHLFMEEPDWEEAIQEASEMAVPGGYDGWKALISSGGTC